MAEALTSLAYAVRFTGNPRRVLIVEDNLDSVRALSALVSDMGHSVQYAINGYAALEIGRKQKPDIVLLDLGLPGMSGFDACRAIRKLPRGAEISIVAVSGWGQEDDRRKTQEAGFDAHLVKPVDFNALLTMLAE